MCCYVAASLCQTAPLTTSVIVGDENFLSVCVDNFFSDKNETITEKKKN